MSTDGETRLGGFMGWLVAVLATLSVLPFGLTSTSAPRSAKPPAANADGESQANPAGTTTPVAAPATLDETIVDALGLPMAESWRGRSLACALDAIKDSTAISIDPIILCVADPARSAVGYRFDLQLNHIQKALEAHGYVLEKWRLPWTATTAEPGEPGLLIFRNVIVPPNEDNAPPQNHLIVVYLVREWMTSGLDREAFGAAVRHIAILDKHLPANCKPSLPILGPVLSGSVDSLGLALRERDGMKGSSRRPIVLNFSALKVDVRRLADLAERCDLDYGETIIQSEAMWIGLSDYLKKIYGRKPKVAWLNETGTAFGVKRVNKKRGLERTYYPFPTGISRVRDAYANAMSDDGKNGPPIKTTDGAILHFPSKDRENLLDSPPRFDAGIQAPYAELALRQILLDIERNDYDVVGISCVDPRDQVFLAEQIRRYVPRAQLVLLGGDLAYEHPDYRRSLQGTIVASTYPMFPTNQQWSFRQSSESRYVFAHQAGHALFNAVSCAMVVGQNPNAFQRCGAVLTVNDPPPCSIIPPIPFVEYGSPHDDGTTEDRSAKRSPPLWISVLGDQGAWPVQSSPPDLDHSKFLIQICGAAANSQKSTGTHDTQPFSLCFILILQAIAACMAYWAAGGFEAPEVSATPLPSDVTWVQPMRQWWSSSNNSGHYDSAKAHRLFTPMFVGLLALWMQVYVCATHQWAIFVVHARQAPLLIIGMLVVFLFAGFTLLRARPVATTIASSVVIALVAFIAWGVWRWFDIESTSASGWMMFFLMLTSFSELLVLRLIVGIVARRRLYKRDVLTNPINDPLLDLLGLVVSVVLIAICLTPTILSDNANRLPWLTTTSSVFNGVSPLLPVIFTFLAIGVICHAEFMRCWLIVSSSFLASEAVQDSIKERGTASTSDKKSKEDQPKEEAEEQQRDEMTYPVSGLETFTLVRLVTNRFLSTLATSLNDFAGWVRGNDGAPPDSGGRDGAVATNGDDARTHSVPGKNAASRLPEVKKRNLFCSHLAKLLESVAKLFTPKNAGDTDKRKPAPHAYILWIGLLWFSAWLAILFVNVGPVYPSFLINRGITLLILFGYLTWAVIFVQALALRFRFFKQLHEFQKDMPPTAAFDAERRPQDEWLGRLLYAKTDDFETDAEKIPSSELQIDDKNPDQESKTAPQNTIHLHVTIVRERRPDSIAKPAPADNNARKRVMGIKRWVAFVGAQLRIAAFGLGIGALLLFFAVSSLPFQPQSWFQFTATLTFVAIGATVATTMIAVDANEVLSRIAGTTPGKVSLDWAQILKLAPWVVVPLVMVIGQTFPELWNWFGVALESWRGP